MRQGAPGAGGRGPAPVPSRPPGPRAALWLGAGLTAPVLAGEPRRATAGHSPGWAVTE